MTDPYEKLAETEIPETGSPNGCKWCAIEERSHYRRWKPPIGFHFWEAPTSEQRKARMNAKETINDRTKSS